MKYFYVVAYDKNGAYHATISGLGCNRGTLSCLERWTNFTFKVESNTRDEVFGSFHNGAKV